MDTLYVTKYSLKLHCYYVGGKKAFSDTNKHFSISLLMENLICKQHGLLVGCFLLAY